MQMNEKLLQYIWQYQLFNKTDIQTSDHQQLQILQPGIHNKNQGPDFLESRIKLNNTLWVGSIEIHINSADWELHKHSDDVHYNNVILHVVWNLDASIHFPFPTLCLKPLVPKMLLSKYDQIHQLSTFIHCEKNIHHVEPIIWEKWKERLVVERLESKSQIMYELLKKANGNWEEMSYWVLAKYMGGKINGEAFEQTAMSLPLNILVRHKESLFQLEALLFGQAGLLTPDNKEEYPQQLLKEYLYLKKKYNLRQPKILIHFLRMRPANFPTIRLAQLAYFFHFQDKILSKIISINNTNSLMNLFTMQTSEYWNTHYRFNEKSSFLNKITGSQQINLLLINVGVNLLFAYGNYHQFEQLKSTAIDWLSQMSSEKNEITNGFMQLGISHKSAYDSQAFIQLRTKYCEEKKCLDCAIGNAIFRKDIVLTLDPVINNGNVHIGI